MNALKYINQIKLRFEDCFGQKHQNQENIKIIDNHVAKINHLLFFNPHSRDNLQ